MPSAYPERFNRALFLASANKTPFLAISVPATAMQLTEHEQQPCFMLDAAQIHADVVDPGYGRMGRLCTGASARSAQFNCRVVRNGEETCWAGDTRRLVPRATSVEYQLTV